MGRILARWGIVVVLLGAFLLGGCGKAPVSQTETSTAPISTNQPSASITYQAEPSNSPAKSSTTSVIISPTPGLATLNMHTLELNGNFDLKAGDSANIDITLNTKNDVMDEVVYSIFLVTRQNPNYHIDGVVAEDKLPIPEGVSITISPDEISTLTHTIYHSTVVVKTPSNLPIGQYIFLLFYRSGVNGYGGRPFILNVLSQ